MSATDELRAMLDEADEYYKTSGNKTWWGRPVDMQTGKPINVFHYQAQPMGEDRLFVELQLATPEQAIAATLGDIDATCERHGDADERDQLKTENAKLRELMSVMAYCNQFRRDCDGCSMNGAAGIITERVGCDELLARLRELGIEVDG